MLECVVALNIVANCSKLNMVTPSVWIAKVYELLYVNSFCSRKLHSNSQLDALDDLRGSFSMVI